MQTLAVRVEGEVDWTAFGIWLAMLLQRHGPDVLRVKGLLRVRGARAGRAQHRRPRRAPARAPRGVARRRPASRLVLIVRGLEAEELDGSLRSFATR